MQKGSQTDILTINKSLIHAGTNSDPSFIESWDHRIIYFGKDQYGRQVQPQLSHSPSLKDTQGKGNSNTAKEQHCPNAVEGEEV